MPLDLNGVLHDSLHSLSGRLADTKLRVIELSGPPGKRFEYLTRPIAIYCRLISAPACGASSI